MYKKILLAALAAISTLSLLAATGSITPSQVSRAPRIDGKLNDNCWKNAPVTTDFILFEKSRDVATRKTEVQMLYTNKSVVFGFKCHIPDKYFPKKDNPEVRPFYLDCVEIMFTPSESEDGYLHFTVNCFNRRSQQAKEQGGVVGNLGWNCEYKSAVYKGKDFWSCEVEIPYSSLENLDSKAKFWRINLMRESYNLPHCGREISSLTGDSHIAANFRKITPPKNVKAYDWGFDPPQFDEKMVDGKQYITVKSTVENRTGSDKNLVFDVRLSPDAGGIASQESKKFVLKNGEKAMFASPALQIPYNGKYTGRMRLLDQASNRVLASKLFKCNANFTPIKIDFIDPHYRDAIFESQKLDKVRGTISIGSTAKNAKVRLQVRKAGEKAVILQQEYPAAKLINFEFANAKLPYGKLDVAVALIGQNNKVESETVKVLRKLEFKPYGMWRGKDGIWRRGGKRFFILGLWGRDTRYSFPEYNLTLQTPKHPGQYKLFHMFTGKNARLLRKEGASPKAKKVWGNLVEQNRDDESIMIYYFMDEPTVGGFGPDNLVGMANHIRDLDPYRPLMISTTAGGNTLFAACAELNALHTYHMSTREKKMANFSKMGRHLDRWKENYDNAPEHLKQGITWMHQGFNYADAGVRESPIPTYESYRSQNICALTMGACGIVQYNRCEEQFPELYLGLVHLNRELKLIGNEAVIQPDSKVKPKSSNSDLRLLGKCNENNNHHWLLAANFSDEARDYTIDFAPFGSKAVQVLSANRKAQFKNGRITEHFTPWEVKVYTDNMSDFKLLTVKEIEDLIEKEYAKRVKPGNIAYQRYENETVEIYASSNAFRKLYNEVGLWHLADGVTEGEICVNPHSNGVVVSKDGTPNQTPDWIEMVFKKPQTIGRVVLYPALDSLKDYQIQVEVDGKYVTVAEVKNAKGKVQEVKFKPVESKKVRLYVTANNGDHTQLFEIEVYSK